MRGGFVARFSLGSGALGPRPQDGFESLRWHRGLTGEFAAGPLRIALLSDRDHGPFIDRAGDHTILAHGSAPAPVRTLELDAGRFAALETDGHTIRASRDSFGEVPLFYCRVADSVWFATEPRPLRDLAGADPDLEVLAAIGGSVADPAETGWGGIRRVLPGTAITFTSTGMPRTERHWDPRRNLASYRGSYEDAVSRAREALCRAVNSMRRDGAAVLLSGGLDSTAIAVCPGPSQTRQRLVHVTFPELPECDETPYAHAAAAAAGAPLDVVSLVPQPWQPEEDLRRHQTPPLSLPTGIASASYAHLAELGVGTVLDGNDGDGVSGNPVTGPALLLLRGHLRRLLELEKRTGWRRLLRATLNDLLPPGLLPGRLNPEPTYADRVAPYFIGGTRLRIERAGRWLPPSRRWREAQVEPLLPPLAVGYENLEMEAASFGVDLRHPFTDRRLVDFMLTLPFEIKADAQRTKPILRDALTDVLPELVRRRAGKTYFNAVIESRVEPARCIDLIRSSGVRLPDVDYARLYKDVDRDPESVHRFMLVHLTRAHVFAAGGTF